MERDKIRENIIEMQEVFELGRNHREVKELQALLDREEQLTKELAEVKRENERLSRLD